MAPPSPTPLPANRSSPDDFDLDFSPECLAANADLSVDCSTLGIIPTTRDDQPSLLHLHKYGGIDPSQAQFGSDLAGPEISGPQYDQSVDTYSILVREGSTSLEWPPHNSNMFGVFDFAKYYQEQDTFSGSSGPRVLTPTSSLAEPETTVSGSADFLARGGIRDGSGHNESLDASHQVDDFEPCGHLLHDRSSNLSGYVGSALGSSDLGGEDASSILLRPSCPSKRSQATPETEPNGSKRSAAVASEHSSDIKLLTKKRRFYTNEELEKVNSVRRASACIRCQILHEPVSLSLRLIAIVLLFFAVGAGSLLTAVV